MKNTTIAASLIYPFMILVLFTYSHYYPTLQGYQFLFERKNIDCRYSLDILVRDWHYNHELSTVIWNAENGMDRIDPLYFTHKK